jgi:hypothetical protein
MSLHAFTLQDIGRSVPYLVHPRRAAHLKALLWLILAHHGSSVAHLRGLCLVCSLGSHGPAVIAVIARISTAFSVTAVTAVFLHDRCDRSAGHDRRDSACSRRAHGGARALVGAVIAVTATKAAPSLSP